MTFWIAALFILFYTGRLLYDVFIENIVFKQSISDLFLFSFGNNFIPFFAVGLNIKKINHNQLFVFFWWSLFISSLLSLLVIYNLYGGLDIKLLAARLSLASEGGSSHSVNPITLSFYGVALTLYSFFFLMFKRKIMKGLLIIGVFLGVLLMLMGASRGPQITFSLTMLFLLYYFTFKYKKTIKKKIKYVGFLGGILAGLSYIMSKIDLEQIALYNRFANFGKGLGSDTSARENAWLGSWNQFLNSPVWGDAYILTNPESGAKGFYPHNIYLEVLMSTGIIGALLFFPLLAHLFFKKIRNENQLGVFLLLLLSLISSTFSGNIFFNPMLFLSIALMTSFSKVKGLTLRDNLYQS